MERDEFQSMPVPLPTELPQSPDLSRLPAHILHSGTVETLIGQNDDLMARLKVNIRRNSVLEQQIMEHERVAGELMRANQSLMSQLQILQEKDRMLRDKTSRAESQQDDLREEIEMLKARLHQAEERNIALALSFRYQERVRKFVRPMIDRLKAQLKSERNTVFAREATISDLRAKLSEAVSHAQDLEAQAMRDQMKLVEHYETLNRDNTTELEKLRAETKLLRDKASRFEKATELRAEAENRIVYLERQKNDLEAQAESHRKLAKQFEIESQGREIEVKEKQAELDKAKESLERLQDQFESLQSVWTESQKKLEAAKQQHESLNLLNQELSRQLKEQRASAKPEQRKELDC